MRKPLIRISLGFAFIVVALYTVDFYPTLSVLGAYIAGALIYSYFG